MSDVTVTENMSTTMARLHAALSQGMFVHARRLINEAPAADVAHLLSSSPPRKRELIWKLVDSTREGDVLQHLDDDLRALFLGRLTPKELAEATQQLDTDDLADLLGDLPDDVYREVLHSMDEQNRQRLPQHPLPCPTICPQRQKDFLWRQPMFLALYYEWS